MKFTRLLQQIIEEELKTNNYSNEDQLIMIEDITLGELLEPDNAYPYEELYRGMFVYEDDNNIEFFVRLTFQPISNPYFEFKTGWLDDNGKPQYDPAVPPISPNSSSVYNNKRSDTVAKIFKDEIIPLFIDQQVSNKLIIKPISSKRMKFAERLVRKFININIFEINITSSEIQIIKK